MTAFSIVVPTVGRPSLRVLLDSLAESSGPRPQRVVVVDDRRGGGEPLDLSVGTWLSEVLVVRQGGGRGPAAARNVGWHATDTDWVVFLDDDVVVSGGWLRDLDRDLAVGPDVVGSQAVIEVPLPRRRRPTDWERGTAGLATAQWITADMAYRRSVLAAVGGFDERFPRAFREDADIALRITARGGRIVRGRRVTQHPVRPARWDASLRAQRGNADDALMTRLHGRDWWAAASAPRGRRREHVATTATLVAAAGCAVTGRRRAAALAATGWLAATARFAWQRIAPGPRDPHEVAAMAATSALVPPAAVWHWARGALEHRHAGPWTPPIEAVLFDRDGTLVHDVPYNGDADLVRPVDGAREALDRLRQRGVRIGLVTNQSGVARGLITPDQVEQVNARLARLLGPFDTVQVCPHDDADGCDCRKPRAGMVLAGAAELGVPVERCAVVGDTGADICAGLNAGAGATVLVPTVVTRTEEIDAAPLRAPDLPSAVESLLTRVRL